MCRTRWAAQDERKWMGFGTEFFVQLPGRKYRSARYQHLSKGRYSKTLICKQWFFAIWRISLNFFQQPNKHIDGLAHRHVRQKHHKNTQTKKALRVGNAGGMANSAISLVLFSIAARFLLLCCWNMIQFLGRWSNLWPPLCCTQKHQGPPGPWSCFVQPSAERKPMIGQSSYGWEVQAR